VEYLGEITVNQQVLERIFINLGVLRCDVYANTAACCKALQHVAGSLQVLGS